MEGKEISISGTVGRRRFLLSGATTLVGLWTCAFGVGREQTTAPRPDEAAWPEAFVVSATPETVAFAYEHGQRLCQQEGELRFKVLIRDEAGCVECLRREMALAVLLPQPMRPDAAAELARRGIALAQFPVIPNGGNAGPASGLPRPPERRRAFYLYAPSALVRKRPRLRVFTRLCQEGRLWQEIPAGPS